MLSITLISLLPTAILMKDLCLYFGFVRFRLQLDHLNIISGKYNHNAVAMKRVAIYFNQICNRHFEILVCLNLNFVIHFTSSPFK